MAGRRPPEGTRGRSDSSPRGLAPVRVAIGRLRACTSRTTSGHPTPRSRRSLRAPGAVHLVTSTARGLLATLLPMVYDEPGVPPGLGEYRRAAGPRRDQERPVARAGDRRVAGDRPRARRLHHAELVRRQARARPGRPDLELPVDPCLRPARRSTRIRRWLEANVRRLVETHEADASRRRGASTTPRAPTSRVSSGRSSAWSCSIDRIEAKDKLSQNRSDSRYRRHHRQASKPTANATSRRRCATRGASAKADRRVATYGSVARSPSMTSRSSGSSTRSRAAWAFAFHAATSPRSPAVRYARAIAS